MPANLPLALEWRTPAELADNPANWREHPEAQSKALAAVVSEVGWAGAALYNRRTNRLIDGHARKLIDPALLVDGKLPVLVGDWTEEQERKILATLDPLAALAEANADKLGLLIGEIETESAELRGMLEGLAAEAAQVVDIPAAPESVQRNTADLAEIQNQRRRGNSNIATERDTEIYLTLVFRDRAARESLLTRLGLPADERYILADQMTIQARKKLLPIKAKGGRKAKTADAKHSGATG
jgi:hypothetical protein